MAVSRKKTSAKSGEKAPVPAKTKAAAATTAQVPSKSVSKAGVLSASSEKGVPLKRVVMTSSEIEAAAQQGDDAKTPIDAVEIAVSPPTVKLPPIRQDTPSFAVASSSQSAPVAEPVEKTVGEDTKEKLAADQAPVAKTPVAKTSVSKAKAAKSKTAVKKASPAKSKAKSTAKASEKVSALAEASDVPSSDARAGAAKAPKRISSTETERARTVSTPSKPAAATTKAASPSTPKKAVTPKKEAAVASVNPATKSAPKPVPNPVSEPARGSAKVDDAFGFGAMFMTPDAMEQYLALWKAPELDAMMAAGNDALEESMSVANEAFTKLFDTMTGQSDVFSDAGSRMAAQCEELLGGHQKNVEEFWQTTMALLEKTGGIGTEIATWMQREIEASQADLDALTKAESVSDFQALQSKILTRYVERTVAEGEKVQEIMFSAMTDSFNAMSKAADAVMK
jgi:hypothetical protein